MKIAIVGSEEHTRDLAPYDDPNYKIWVFNEWANAKWCRRWDMLFQLHVPQIYQNLNNEADPEHWGFLQKRHGKPIVMQAVDPKVPDSVKYPLDEINRKFLSTLTFEGETLKNFRTTASYVIALGLYARVESMDFYGIEMVQTAEYRSQQNNFAFWVGVATGLKVPVNMHCSRGTFDYKLYGYETYNEVQVDRLVEYIEGMKGQLSATQLEAAKVEGAIMFANQLLDDRKRNA